MGQKKTHLNIFIDEEGFIRVGGRINKPSVEFFACFEPKEITTDILKMIPNFFFYTFMSIDIYYHSPGVRLYLLVPVVRYIL